ncbi:VIT domain-containing protein [Acanthopleuribacter pedis]|uniref:VWA domain-containing protein n=1 Tax=Acanthopleuribacter pedis TaxID=442870 RepID=A0A8J7QGK8_9BACT|nr:VIT domain-containing protein [Acanthopleuribacter pedis]MBO1319961.1 VWA domain-containing protein [Acanthopleuribacter pedis]
MPIHSSLVYGYRHRIAIVKLAFILLFLWSAATPSPAGAGDHRDSAGVLTGYDEERNERILPLKETNVHLEITGNAVHARVRQTFFNDSVARLEALYNFPLPDEATVTDMFMQIGERRIRGVVQEKETARQTYEQAKRSGRRASLIEHQRQNLFETRVANLQPGDEITITFTYLTPLPRVDDRYELVFPTVFGARYHMGHTDDGMVELHPLSEPPPVQAQAPLVQPGRVSEAENNHFVTLTANVAGIPVADIQSPSHEIFIDHHGERHFAVELSPVDNLPNRDFVLFIEPYLDEEPQLSLVQSHQADGVHGMLTLYPPLEDVIGTDPTPKDIVFLVDTSGSMGGLPMQQAKDGLKACLAMLHDRDRFNIVRFSSDFSSYTQTYESVSSENLSRAHAYIDNLASGGGTEMQQALAHVLDLPESPEHLKMVVLLTDGDVGNENRLLALVQRTLGNARLFSFGIGSAPNEHLLKRISEQGQGVANFLRNNEDIGQVVSNFIETINTPVLTDVTLDFSDRAGNPQSIRRIYPSRIPDLFLGRPLRLLFQNDQPITGYVGVGGYLNGRWVQYDFAVDQGRKTHLPGLEKLVGSAQIKDLTADHLTAPYDQKAGIRDQIVALGLKYQLVTPYTSRVAVEERLQKMPDGSLTTVRVPIMRRANGLAATATNDFNLLLAAALLLALAAPLYVLQHTFGRKETTA